MEIYDVIMILVLMVATMLGAWQGMAWQVASIASVVVSYLVALNFREPVAALIQTDPPWNMFLAMLVLYLGTSLLIWLAFQVVAKFIDRLKLKEFDRQAGALIGLAKGILLCVIITLFAVTLLSEGPRRSIVNSYSGYYIAVLLDKAHPIMPKQLHSVLHPYLHDPLVEGRRHTTASEPDSPKVIPASRTTDTRTDGQTSRR